MGEYDATKLYRKLNGLDLPPRERAECIFSQNAGEAMGLPAGNVKGLLDNMTLHFEDREDALSASQARVTELEGVLAECEGLYALGHAVGRCNAAESACSGKDTEARAHKILDKIKTLIE